MKLSCQEHLLPGDTIGEKWTYAREVGFDAIELRGAGDLGLEARLDELRAARREGAVFSSVCVAMSNFVGDADAEVRRDAVTNIKSQLSVIAELGGAGVITPASYGKYSRVLARLASPLSAEQQSEVLSEALRELGEHAGREGVKVLLEPLNRYETNVINTLVEGMALCGKLGLKGLALMADLYHMNIEEDDPNRALEESAPLLAHIHVCDSNRHEPGAGHIDFAAVAKALRGIGYDGYLALECRLRAAPQTALQNAVAVLRAAFG
jgi:sugar phosphate isomerase/epimerase